MRSMTHIAAGIVLTSLVFGAAADSKLESKPPKKPRYTEVQVSDGGTISGTVRFTGKVDQESPVEITTSEDICHAEPVFSEDLVVGENGGVE